MNDTIKDTVLDMRSILDVCLTAINQFNQIYVEDEVDSTPSKKMKKKLEKTMLISNYLGQIQDRFQLDEDEKYLLAEMSRPSVPIDEWEDAKHQEYQISNLYRYTSDSNAEAYVTLAKALMDKLFEEAGDTMKLLEEEGTSGATLKWRVEDSGLRSFLSTVQLLWQHPGDENTWYAYSTSGGFTLYRIGLVDEPEELFQTYVDKLVDSFAQINPNTKTFTVDTVDGSATIAVTDVGDATFEVGKELSGTGIPTGAKIQSVTGTPVTSVTMDVNATADNTGVTITETPPNPSSGFEDPVKIAEYLADVDKIVFSTVSGKEMFFNYGSTIYDYTSLSPDSWNTQITESELSYFYKLELDPDGIVDQLNTMKSDLASVNASLNALLNMDNDRGVLELREDS